ncbi:MAG: hypothetical protein NZ521_11165 [Flammeovirgaceae bacterium]|nr:hypothetical protein [Flammeovirgaceae bacterium]MDW8288377.1 hypothetical protein [Flammeovirgaceae bacterium]
MKEITSAQDVQAILDECKKKGKKFVIVEDDTGIDEGCIHFRFVGDYEGRKVVYDTFLSTLELEFYERVYEEAIEITKEENPQYANANFDDLEGEHIEIMEQIAEELAEDEDFAVQEYCYVEEENEFQVNVDVALNVPVISDEVVEKFIDDFLNNKLELDENYYSFGLGQDDEDEE